MADSLLTDLTALTAPDKDDPVYITDDPAVTPLDRKITLENLFKVINTFTAEAAPVAGDYIAVYDTSASAARRVLVSSIMAVSHNHAASEVTSGTLTHERGGLEADVSAYSGLVKITSGTTSAITVTSAAESVLDDATTGAMLTTLGIGSVENTALSTWAGTANITTLGTVTTGTWNGTALEGTAIASTGETGGTKFLREDGDGTCSWQAAAGAGDFLADGTVAMTGDINADGNNIDNGGVIFLKEQADADADVAGSGQIWVNTATPNELWFTNDAGTDVQLGTGGGSGDFLADGSVAMTGDINADGSNIDNIGVLMLKEQAAADADVAGSGQIWVKTATPNQLYFTDDAGTDARVSTESGWYELTDGVTITVDGNNGNRQYVELGGNRSIEWTNLRAGQAILLRIRQDVTGSRLISSWGTLATVNWPAATAPTLTTTADKSDLIGFVVLDDTDDAEIILGMAVEFNFVDT